LQKTKSLYLLSGDNDKERNTLKQFFGGDEQLWFNQTPAEKLSFINQLKHQGNRVMMVGDGLNDAGALKAADLGISITEHAGQFSPASDVIMSAEVFNRFPQFMLFAKRTLRVIHISFIISLIYNIIGLSFAVQGTLSPLIAAILMPVSSVTVIAFTTLATTLAAKKGGLS
jgi:Cu+-exporting ATPase